MPTFKIIGQLYHRIGSLMPKPNEQAKCLQIYFIGNEEQQCSSRKSYHKDLKTSIIVLLQTLLKTVNPVIFKFKTLTEYSMIKTYPL